MNRKEYNIAVKDLSGRLYGYCLKYLRNSADSSDIVQDAFEKLWKNRKKVDFDKAKPWLFSTAHNTLINFISKKNRITYMYELESKESARNLSHDFEVKEVVDNCLATLPPVQKSIVLLRDLEGYNYKEISEILNLTESQVKVYLFRARNKIKKQLKGLTVLEVKHA
ncbi:MAG: RNA polymerase sigma factor [Putridiphycobacter sp.]